MHQLLLARIESERLQSQMLHAHRQTISTEVPGDFLSNSQWSATYIRDNKRPRKPDRPGPPAASAGPVAPMWINAPCWHGFATGGWSGTEWRDPAPPGIQPPDGVGFDPEQLLLGMIPEIRDARVLVLSELNHIVVWHEYHRNRVFVRPEADRHYVFQCEVHRNQI